MKYKCITKCFIEDSVIMNPGDIVVIDEDNLFNITTGVDYRNIPDIENLKSCVEKITDYCNTSTSKTDADRFKDITSRDLILELRARGYKGKLQKISVVDVVI